MDLDAYVAAHAFEWQRLEELTKKRRLTGAEADEGADERVLEAGRPGVVADRPQAERPLAQ